MATKGFTECTVLLELTDAGADVELGSLGTELVEQKTKTFSFEKLVAITGEDYAKELIRIAKNNCAQQTA